MSSIAEHLGNVFQLAYVTNNLDGAISRLRTRYGFSEVQSLGALVPDEARYLGGPADMAAQGALAFSGRFNLEVIQPLSGTSVGLYADALTTRSPEAPLELVLHHVGVPVDDLQAALRPYAALGLTPVLEGRVKGFCAFAYVDMRRELGHYVELVQLEPAARAFFRLG